MHPHLERLHPYPFQKLAKLFADTCPPDELNSIPLSIGEPRHPPPQFVLDELKSNLHRIASYPLTRGLDELREAVADWIKQRFHADISADKNVLPVNGTREALFAFAQCVVDSRNQAKVLMPNPFYQIYEGAAILAGAEPVFINTLAENNFLPDLDAVPDTVWQQCQLFYACSPGNPTGAVFPRALWVQLLELADRFDFVIAADECYSEIYENESSPPVGLLEVCAENNRTDFSRCMVFHSLSKRSNLPGLRSGFVAGDASLIAKFLTYRTYHGCAMSVPNQLASIAAWHDETHVLENRNAYREKYDLVVPLLSPWMEFTRPEASFYLWPKIPGGNDEGFARGLFEQQHVTVLPGSYLSRGTDNGNPGSGHVRMALVAETSQCLEAANRIVTYCKQL